MMDKRSDIVAKKNKVGLFWTRFIAYFVLCLLCAASLLVFYILIINSTRAHPEILKGFSFLPGRFTAVNFQNMLKSPVTPVITGILNSLLVSTGVAALSCYFSAFTAFGIHAYNFRFRNAAFAAILAIMIIPTQVSASGFVQLVYAVHLQDSFIPLIVPAIASPVVFFFMKQYMESALPLEMIEAARIDGSGELRTFNRIVLPVMKPALAVQAIFTFVGAWNNYFIPALILESNSKKTLPIVIAQLRSADFTKFDMGQLYMTIAVAIVPIVVVYLILSKFIVRGVAMGSVKG